MPVISPLSSTSPRNCPPWFTLIFVVHVLSLTLLSLALSQLNQEEEV